MISSRPTAQNGPMKICLMLALPMLPFTKEFGRYLPSVCCSQDRQNLGVQKIPVDLVF